MEEIVKAINELSKTIDKANILTDILIPSISVILSIGALLISFIAYKKSVSISLLPEKEKIFKELDKLVLYYVTYMTSENPFKKNDINYGSEIKNEEDIISRARMFFGDKKIDLVRRLRDKHLEITQLNLEAQIFFDKLELKDKNIYNQLKTYVNKEASLNDFKTEEEIAKLSYENILFLDEDVPQCNYYEVRKEIIVLNNEISKLYFLWQVTKEKIINL